MGQPTTPKKTSGIFDSRTLFPYQNKNFPSVKVLSWFKLGQQSCVVVFHLHSPHVCTNTNPSGSCARSGTVGRKPCQSNVWVRSFPKIHSITSATLPDRIPVWFYNIRQVENQQYYIFLNVFICSVLINVYFECYVLCIVI